MSRGLKSTKTFLGELTHYREFSSLVQLESLTITALVWNLRLLDYPTTPDESF